MDIGTLENERRRKILEGEQQQISGGWNLAREPNMEDSPYRLFRAPSPYDDPEDYRGQPMFFFPKGGGQGEFLFPFVQNFDDSPDMKRQKNMLEGDVLEEGTQNEVELDFRNLVPKIKDSGPDEKKPSKNMLIAKLPYTPPTEKMLIGNRFMDSPLRFKSEQQRADELEAYSRNFKYRGN